ncbi:non-canonical purine NTP pyrophosphatase, RdgB/HAM1 family [Candidatus Falkowbacteria bacterium HGW-Falkowbacteria-1]|jgi:XTP/dITP diphosphohydrolase|uniref:dITP/XTP pyrophosphatase n=1 Tax=Candidatus Falkowbacteria bacterium HGW-Falkowbacteria-1 TaxID=2013768 RepID=A0A2N2E9W9_9BACT|nr:MAG: non-canonical purine NTP pyrophosphatase, RdgB/HAM1 family [Candidatus Falkowbacteria bacterium HGW-Falkowbacteria-1]
MNNKSILIATANRGKAKEIKEIFKDTDFDLKFLFDFPEEFKDLKILENAKSFEGNALIKAIVSGELMKMIVLADDSGFCVDALNGRPGVYSARYSEEGTDQANYLKIIEEMSGVEIRTCHYNCTVAIYDPQTKFVDTVFGTWQGKIALEPKGEKSFGYAPIFLAKEFDYQKTNAELDHEELIAINHRGKAFKKAIKVLNEYLKK